MKTRLQLAGLLATTLAFGHAFAGDLFLDKDTVVANEGRIGDRWMLADGATLATPVYPAHLAGRGDDVCVAIGYRILPDGTTSEFAVLKQWSSAGDGQPDDYWRPFAEAGAEALAQWRFQERPGVTARPTYTVATMVFSGTAGNDAGARDQCRIGDLAAVMQQRTSESYLGSRDRHSLDRAMQSVRTRAAMNENPGRR